MKAPDATVADAGRIEATEGVGLAVIVNDTPLMVPPPGVGLKTVTIAVPAVLRSLLRIAALNCVELTKVVARAVPFHCTCEVGMNPLPVTDKLSAVAPMAAEEGRIELTEGAGLAAIVKAMPVDVPPPGEGLITVTVAVPTVETSAAVIAAVN